MRKQPLSALLAVLCVLGLTACQSAAPEMLPTETEKESVAEETSEPELPDGIRSSL